jgi:hypothetical protein
VKPSRQEEQNVLPRLMMLYNGSLHVEEQTKRSAMVRGKGKRWENGKGSGGRCQTHPVTILSPTPAVALAAIAVSRIHHLRVERINTRKRRQKGKESERKGKEGGDGHRLLIVNPVDLASPVAVDVRRGDLGSENRKEGGVGSVVAVLSGEKGEEPSVRAGRRGEQE